MTSGIYLMHESFVASWDILVRYVPQGMPDSAPELDKFGWMMLPAGEVKVLYSIVGTTDGVSMTAVTEKMHR